VKANELISSREIESNIIVCLRCGAKNMVGPQFCKMCKAVLPYSDGGSDSIDVTETDDTDEDIQNEDIKYFKRLIGQFSRGQIERPVLKDYIDKFSRKVLSTKKNFEQLLRPFLSKNPDVKELKLAMDGFLAIFDEFQSCLDEGALFFNDGNKEYLEKSLAGLIKADGKSQELMKQVRTYMAQYSSEGRQK
jgi:hypothetical protein